MTRAPRHDKARDQGWRSIVAPSESPAGFRVVVLAGRSSPGGSAVAGCCSARSQRWERATWEPRSVGPSSRLPSSPMSRQPPTQSARTPVYPRPTALVMTSLALAMFYLPALTFRP
jgi:hypothetical protein